MHRRAVLLGLAKSLLVAACAPTATPTPTSVPTAKPTAAQSAPPSPAAKPTVAPAPTTAAPTTAAVAYPTRPITLIVGYGPGGATDLAARAVAAHMEKTLGQPINVENRPGGNGAVGMSAVGQAAPDWYTIGMMSGSILTVMPFTTELGFDPLEFTYIGSTHESMAAQLVRADAPWKTIDEMVEWAKANPGQLIHATSGGFGLNDIGMEMLSRATGGFEYRTLPTSGGAEQIQKLLAGDAQTCQNSAAPTLPHLRSGAVRALLIISPSWPELEQMGVPKSKDRYNFTIRNLSAIIGPPKMPEPTRQRLEDALKIAMDDSQVKEQLNKIGELIVFKTGKQVYDDIVQVQRDYETVIEALGKKVR